MTDATERRTTVLYELWRTSRRAAALVDEALADTPLAGTDFGLYSLLKFSAPLTPSEVARRSAMPLTTASEALRRMEDRGHLRRAPNPADARSVTVDLTEAGRRAHAETGAAFQVLLRAVYAELGGEVDHAIYSLARLDRALASVAGDVPDDLSPLPTSRAVDSSMQTLTYAGAPLTAAEEDEVRRFADWLRFRREPSRPIQERPR